MDERDEDALLHLLDRRRPPPGRARCASTARAGRATWSSIHPLFGVWSSGWLRKNGEPAAGPQDAGDLGDGVVDVADVLEHEAGDDVRRSGRRRTRQRRRAGPGVGRPPAALGATDTWFQVGSTPTTTRRAGTRRAAGRPARRRSRRRAPAGRRPASCGRQREDLLLVLGVGAVGEALVPPAGVLLPEVVRSSLTRAGRWRTRAVGHRARQPGEGLGVLERRAPSRPSRRPAPSPAACARVAPRPGDVVEHARSSCACPAARGGR